MSKLLSQMTHNFGSFSQLIFAGIAALLFAACTAAPAPEIDVIVPSPDISVEKITASPTYTPTVATFIQPTNTAPPTSTPTRRPTATPVPTATLRPIPTPDPIFQENVYVLFTGDDQQVPAGLEGVLPDKETSIGYVTPELAEINAQNEKIGRIRMEFHEYTGIYGLTENIRTEKRDFVQPINMAAIPGQYSCSPEQVFKLHMLLTPPGHGSSVHVAYAWGTEIIYITALSTGQTRTVMMDGAEVTAVQFVYALPGYQIRKGWTVSKIKWPDGTTENTLMYQEVADNRIVLVPIPDAQLSTPMYLNFTWFGGERENGQISFTDPARAFTSFKSWAYMGSNHAPMEGKLKRMFALQQAFEMATGNGSQFFLSGQEPPGEYTFVPSLGTTDAIPTLYPDMAEVADLYNLDLAELAQCTLE